MLSESLAYLATTFYEDLHLKKKTSLCIVYMIGNRFFVFLLLKLCLMKIKKKTF